MVVCGFVTHSGAGAQRPLDATLVYGTAGTASHHRRCTRRGRPLLLTADAVVVNVRRVQQRHVRRVTHAESVVAAATARRTVHRCPPHALDRLRLVIHSLHAHAIRSAPADRRKRRIRYYLPAIPYSSGRDFTLVHGKGTGDYCGSNNNIRNIKQKQTSLITTAAALITASHR